MVGNNIVDNTISDVAMQMIPLMPSGTSQNTDRSYLGASQMKLRIAKLSNFIYKAENAI